MSSPISIDQAQLLHLLKTHFGYDSFRPQQEAIIQNVMAGQDSLVIMPTGGGKSMCFQLPALALSGVTIVISPLIALMKDQVDSLKANGIKAAYFNSSQAQEEQRAITQQLENDSLKLLYVAPESLPQLYYTLKHLNIALFAIDEAHCISSWGHDFRPAYKELAFLKKEFPQVPLIALTATADRATREDIAAQLHIPAAKTFIASFDRPNLYLDVRPGQKRKQQILHFLDRHPDQSGIIYCLSRKSTEKLAQDLQRQGYKVAAYHAGLSAEERARVQENFVSDRTPIITATIAFGMGIDKSNVRWVIHYNMPKNIESYYQEIGRAGRDGLPSDTLLFYSYSDVRILREFAEGSPRKDYKIAKLERMQQYAEALSCRRKTLLSYFGEHLSKDCGHCDVCQNPPQYFDGTVIAQKICSAIARLKEQEPVNMVVDVLRGSHNAQVLEKGYQHIKTYGAAQDLSWRNLHDYIIQLTNQGVIEIWFHEKGRLILTPIAKQILFKGLKVRLANINQISKRQQSTGSTLTQSPLFGKLRQLRSQLAEAAGVPAYVIFGDASLQDMDDKLPQSTADFAQITGVGQTKLERYATDFLKVIKAYIAEHPEVVNIDKKQQQTKKKKQLSLLEKLEHQRQKLAEQNECALSAIATDIDLDKIAIKQPTTSADFKRLFHNQVTPVLEYATDFMSVLLKTIDQQNRKALKLSSHAYSYQLYCDKNLSVDEIAQQRGLSSSTVIGHFVKMHQEGHDFDFSKFISSAEIDSLKKAQIALADAEGLKPYFEYFNEKMPYEKIRLGLYLLAEAK